MKLIYYSSYEGHHKNKEAILRMCKSAGIEIEISSDKSLITKPGYDILVAFGEYIDPIEIPEEVKIIFGPQLWVFPQGDLVTKPHTRGVYNVLSKWVGEMCKEFDLSIPCVEFPFSVNTEKFKPIPTENKVLDCIVYVKNRKLSVVNEILQTIHNRGLTYKIFIYGKYTEQDYIEALQNCKFVVSVDASESQGFALEEAMSCDVPLIVVDAISMHDYSADGYNSAFEHLRPKKLAATSVPYWSDNCGIKITEVAEFNSALEKMITDYKQFTPRNYILENLSDVKCMSRILDYFDLKVSIQDKTRTDFP